jgi:hypothetical protein
MAMKKKYYTVEGEIIGERSEAGRINYGVDALGSVTSTMAGDSVQNTYAYKPYGALLSKTGTGADPSFLWVGTPGYRYTGRSHSDYYVRARHYDSTTGRWSTVDPLWPFQPQYGYPHPQFPDFFGLTSYYVGTRDPYDVSTSRFPGWNSMPKTDLGAEIWALVKKYTQDYYVIVPHAARNMLHYLGNSGSEFDIQVPDLLRGSIRTNIYYTKELLEAKAFVCRNLRSGNSLQFTSRFVSSVGLDMSDSLDWFLALGSFQVWGKGVATRCNNAVDMYFFFRVHDLYDWHAGAGILGGLIQDTMLLLLHYEGRAREYALNGVLGVHVEYTCE